MFDVGPGPVIGIVLGIPAVGFAARMVIRAVADGIARVKTAGQPPVLSADPDRGEQTQRIAQLEAELSALRDEMGRLASVEQFYAQLQAPPSSGARAPEAPPPGAAAPAAGRS